MADKLTDTDIVIPGIVRAIKAAGTQAELALKLSEELGMMERPIRQGTIAQWVRYGYVPRARAPAVAKITGIPLVDLVRQTKRTSRSYA